jgi:penicillin-binding protein 1A
LPSQEFTEPETGLTKLDVCNVSGKLPTEHCNEGTHEEIFLTGTEPREFCSVHKFEEEQDQRLIEKMKRSILSESIDVGEEEIPGLDDSLFKGMQMDEDLGDIFESNEVENPLLD